MLLLVLADLVLLDSSLLLLSDPADVELLGFDLAALLHFLLIGQHEKLLWHTYLFDTLHIHSLSVRSNAALVPHHMHLLLLLGAMVHAISTVMLVMTSMVLSVAMMVVREVG